jgi:ankyrin repeat protein
MNKPPTPTIEQTRELDRQRHERYERCYMAVRDHDFEQMERYLQSGEVSAEDLLARVVRTELISEARYLLAERGMDPRSALMWCDLQNVQSLDMYHLLAEFGLDFRDFEGRLLMEKLESPEIFEWLLDHGMDINSGPGRIESLLVGETDDTCLVLNEAARRGSIDLFEYLVSRGADPFRSLALHSACLCSHPEQTTSMMEHLLEKYGFDVSAQEKDHALIYMTSWTESRTPMMYAIDGSNVAAVKLLLQHGAKDDLENVFFQAYLRQFEPGLRAFLDAGVNSTRCLATMLHERRPPDFELQAARLCLDYGADPYPALVYAEGLASINTPQSRLPSMKMKGLLEEAKEKWDAERKQTDHEAVESVRQKLARLRGIPR